MLIDIRNGLPTELIIRKGGTDFSQPLDYLGVPFKCFRCNVFGHLMKDCSLPYNKNPFVSVCKTWRVKNRGVLVDELEGTDKEYLGLKTNGLSSDFVSADLNFLSNPLEDNLPSPSTTLSPKPLSILSLFDPEGLGRNLNDIDHFDAQYFGLRDLGFVSPPKVILAISKGYFLRSSSKFNKDELGSAWDPDGFKLSVKSNIGICGNLYSDELVGSEALRALKASTVFPSRLL